MVMVTVEILEIEVLFCTYVWVTSMGHRTKRILRIERKEYQTY